ncbi:hypothetical protein [Gallaecimonas mangrovi]|uniref:hypothetical protein n=1 Tax=Gallaecimonas mangrovi TaxID=2291597 RepID=UPI0012603006|nr:hypothetical protein [Gallaecimonas mangrovi]
MTKHFLPMHGPLDAKAPNVTGRRVGRQLTYSAFSWSELENAYPLMRQLAVRYGVGLVDVSADNDKTLLPPETPPASRQAPTAAPVLAKKPWWRFW